ncbi:hypothetical protein GEMRC1_007078 [Eukaryota sp. GEM-RC1]
MPPRYFHPDINSIGGRDLLTLEKFNHSVNLMTSRSSLPSSRPSSSRKIISEKSARDLNNRLSVRGNEYSEVYETYRRVSNVRSRIDNSEPKSLSYRNLSSNRRKRQTDTIRNNHQLELHHLQRRIKSSHSNNNRTKNSLDPTVYPSKVLRKSSKPSIPDFSIEDLIESVSYDRSSNGHLSYSAPTISAEKKQIKKETFIEPKHVFTSRDRSRFPLPSLKNVKTSDDLYNVLFQSVVSNRLFKTEQLHELCAWVDEHDNLSEEVRLEAIARLQKNFDF